MPDTKLSALSVVTAPALGDLIYIDQGGVSYSALPDWYLGLMTQTAQGRVTLTTGTPVADGTAQSTVYFTPFNGNMIALYNGTLWSTYEFVERSVVLSGLTNAKNYDLFGYIKAGALAIDLGPTWNSGASAGSDTARGTGAGSTDLVLQAGVYVNTNAVTGTINGDSIAAKTGRYLGSIRTTGATTTEDSVLNRLVFNAQNRVIRAVRRYESTTSWVKGALGAATWRQANASVANQITVLSGLPGLSALFLQTESLVAATAATVSANVGIGEDSTTALATESSSAFQFISVNNGFAMGVALLNKSVPLGYHFYAWLEQYSGGTPTWYGTSAPSVLGMSGSIVS